ncbi:MAG: hypothetical protein PW788_01140 [Micavibrio sp.]|nr:hypothetical protein [Micavibrio sp.]
MNITKLTSLCCILGVLLTLSVTPAMAEEAEGGGEGGKALAIKPDFEYFEMKPIILPIITDKGLTQQVSLVISLELPYGTRDDIKPLEPKLADAYIGNLYGALGSGGVMMKGNIIDVVAVKDRLTKETTRILGEGKVHQVLLQVVQQSSR